MNKNKKLGKVLKQASCENLDLMAILENLILTSENCRTTCTLLEMAKKKSLKIFKKIEKTRTVLNLLD